MIFGQFYLMAPKSKTDLYQSDLRKVGERLRTLRINAGYGSLDLFAWEHGLPRTGYAYLEQGKNFQFTTLLRVLAIHGLSMQEFFASIK